MYIPFIFNSCFHTKKLILYPKKTLAVELYKLNDDINFMKDVY